MTAERQRFLGRIPWFVLAACCACAPQLDSGEEPLTTAGVKGDERGASYAYVVPALVEVPLRALQQPAPSAPSCGPECLQVAEQQLEQHYGVQPVTPREDSLAGAFAALDYPASAAPEEAAAIRAALAPLPPAILLTARVIATRIAGEEGVALVLLTVLSMAEFEAGGNSSEPQRLEVVLDNALPKILIASWLLPQVLFGDPPAEQSRSTLFQGFADALARLFDRVRAHAATAECPEGVAKTVPAMPPLASDSSLPFHTKNLWICARNERVIAYANEGQDENLEASPVPVNRIQVRPDARAFQSSIRLHEHSLSPVLLWRTGEWVVPEDISNVKLGVPSSTRKTLIIRNFGLLFHGQFAPLVTERGGTLFFYYLGFTDDKRPVLGEAIVRVEKAPL